MPRSSWSITWSVWQALFLREALYRLFHRRGAWVWLLSEPIGHIAFLMIIFSLLGLRVIGGIETALWLMVGLLGFFMFRRTMTLAMAAVSMSKALFAYRQVKPVDVVLVRAATEGMLMLVIFWLLMAVSALFGVSVWPDDWLRVFGALFSFWLMGLGLGLILSVPHELVHEVGDIVNMVITPIYLVSGVMFPLIAVPEPYRDWLILNPVVHSIEEIRLGFASHYVAIPELDVGYPYLFALVCILLGLVLHRIYQKKLIQQ